MTDYSDAKFREFIEDRLERDGSHIPAHTGLVPPESEASDLLAYFSSIYNETDPELKDSFRETEVYKAIVSCNAPRHLGNHIQNVPAASVGVTEDTANLSNVETFRRVQDSLMNNDAPYIGTMFGPPNAGKTTLAVLYVEIWKSSTPLKYPDSPDPVVLSNSGNLDCVDYVCQSMSEFRRQVFGDEPYRESNGDKGEPPLIDEDTPTFWLFDECSTHCDARTNRMEVAKQYLPLLKRFAKVNLDSIHIGHSGTDIHPELRRETLVTEFLFKQEKTVAEVHAQMEDYTGSDLKYSLDNIDQPETTIDPDSFAPWSWDEI